MSEAVMQDMRTSMKILAKAEPIIKDLLKGGYMLSVEGSDDEICQMLDRSCGIDYFHVYDKTGLTWGVASRFQEIGKGQQPYNTFTVRMERETGVNTEFAKRKYAIENHGEYPYLTLQGYYDKHGEILSLCIAKTKDVIECVEKGHYYTKKTGADKIGQAFFAVVKWDTMEDLGYQILKYRDISKMSIHELWITAKPRVKAV